MRKFIVCISILIIVMLCAFFIACETVKDRESDSDKDEELIAGIKSINEYYADMKKYDGVSMRTEFDIYSPDTKRIMAYWENNTDKDFTFGESYNLFKKQDDEFVPVVRANYSYVVNSIGYPLYPGKTREQSICHKCQTYG